VRGCGNSTCLPGARYLLPSVKRLDANGVIFSSGHPVTAGAKQMIHGAMGGENALGMAGGPEPRHRSLSLSSRRVGQRGVVVQPRVLAVLDARHPRLASCFVAFEWVGDDHPRHVTQALEVFAEEALGSALVASGLNPDVEHRTILIHCSPAVIPSTVDAERDLVQIPTDRRAARRCNALANLAEFLQTPRADRLVGDVESPTAALHALKNSHPKRTQPTTKCAISTLMTGRSKDTATAIA